MRCPRCGNDNDKVLESRSNRDGTSIRRRRKCLECGHRFTSYERIEEKPIIVIKKDGRHQPFDISKVERGIRQCTEKLSIKQEEIDEILHNIEDKDIYRPHAWSAFGTKDLEGADYRACANYKQLYK